MHKLNANSDLNVLHLRAAYFMENSILRRSTYSLDGTVRACVLLPDLKRAHDRDALRGDYAAPRLLDADFSGKQNTRTLGDVSLLWRKLLPP